MWSIKNLSLTRDDPSRQYRRSPIARKGRVIIGARKVSPGGTALLSDAVYQKFSRQIRMYEACGLILVTNLSLRGGGEQAMPVEDTSPMAPKVVESAPPEAAGAPQIGDGGPDIATESVAEAQDDAIEETPEEPIETPEEAPVEDVVEPAVAASILPDDDDDDEPATETKRRKVRAPKERA